ncbi:MAG: FecR domain-containing protein [Cyclobacteriaceae bacterium]
MDSEIIEILSKEGHFDAPQEKEAITQILATTANWEAPSNRSNEEVWASLESGISGKEAKVVVFKPWLKWAASTAAVALVTLSLYLLNPQEYNFSATEITEIELPDGSSVILNAGSQLAYQESILGERNLRLDGKAFFEVIPGDAFSVETDKGTVTVLGTSFNVNSLGDRFDVECLTGKVKVKNSTNEVYLTPGLAVYAGDGTFEAVRFNVESGKTWIKGIFSYSNEPLVNVVNELEKQYQIEIEVSADHMERGYSGLFNITDDEELTMRSIFGPMGLTFEKTGANSYIVK